MSDVVVGAVLGLLASLVTTVALKVLDWRRENDVRWDRDLLLVATEALVCTERAMGTIYAWSKGLAESADGAGRPERVDQALDEAHYKLKTLSILFPRIAATVDELQSTLIQLARLTGEYRRSDDFGQARYLEESEDLRTRIKAMADTLLTDVQTRLRVDR